MGGEMGVVTKAKQKISQMQRELNSLPSKMPFKSAPHFILVHVIAVPELASTIMPHVKHSRREIEKNLKTYYDFSSLDLPKDKLSEDLGWFAIKNIYWLDLFPILFIFQF